MPSLRLTRLPFASFTISGNIIPLMCGAIATRLDAERRSKILLTRGWGKTRKRSGVGVTITGLWGIFLSWGFVLGAGLGVVDV